jgi:hypothetical protein
MRSDFTARLAELLDVPVYRAIFWHRASDLVGPFLGSFILGSTAGALIVGLVTYAVTVRLLAGKMSSSRVLASNAE